MLGNLMQNEQRGRRHVPKRYNTEWFEQVNAVLQSAGTN
jgi:hypothetical protein